MEVILQKSQFVFQICLPFLKRRIFVWLWITFIEQIIQLYYSLKVNISMSGNSILSVLLFCSRFVRIDQSSNEILQKQFSYRYCRYTTQTCYSLFNFYFHGTSLLTTVCTLCLHLTLFVLLSTRDKVTSIYCEKKLNDLKLMQEVRQDHYICYTCPREM